jgi:hypothetical protein
MSEHRGGPVGVYSDTPLRHRSCAKPLQVPPVGEANRRGQIAWRQTVNDRGRGPPTAQGRAKRRHPDCLSTLSNGENFLDIKDDLVPRWGASDVWWRWIAGRSTIPLDAVSRTEGDLATSSTHPRCGATRWRLRAGSGAMRPCGDGGMRWMRGHGNFNVELITDESYSLSRTPSKGSGFHS